MFQPYRPSSEVVPSAFSALVGCCGSAAAGSGVPATPARAHPPHKILFPGNGFFTTALYLKLSKCAGVGRKYFVNEKVTILKNLGVLDVGRWIGGRVGRCGGREGLRELATWPVPPASSTRVTTTTWLTSIGPPTGRSTRDGPIPRELLGHHPIRGIRDGQMKR